MWSTSDGSKKKSKFVEAEAVGERLRVGTQKQQATSYSMDKRNRHKRTTKYPHTPNPPESKNPVKDKLVGHVQRKGKE